MNAKKIIIVPTTHWDREWYVPFNEFRAYLVIMIDKLIEILQKNSAFKNFTLDGQTIPLEDYLEVRPENMNLLKKLVEKKKISIGPFYVLPDEFLISGESLIRNLIIGHKVAKKFGSVMKAGYIPDPFGHIAQLPQILCGFNIHSFFFMRGLGNEWDENELSLEFQWNAPGNTASVLSIFLKNGYYSAANLNTKTVNGNYKNAIKQIRGIIRRLEKFAATKYLLLNNGGDHLFVQAKLPDIVRQWNEKYPNNFLEINDFKCYSDFVIKNYPKLKTFQGELRGGKFHHLLSGVLSTRIWIKQKNTELEYLYEKCTEPISTITWILDIYQKFKYPSAYLLTGLKWLLKNHPHDSICGCSIDEVHEEMKIRFQWSEQIGNEILKNSLIYLSKLIEINDSERNKFALIVYNPLPWKRKDIINFDILTLFDETLNSLSSKLKICDYKNEEIEYQLYHIKEKPRFQQVTSLSFRINFLAEAPACGYKIYYLFLNNNPKRFTNNANDFNLTENSIENNFYKIELESNGKINIFEKLGGILYENILVIEDVGDWGDEYDFSGPGIERFDKLYSTQDASQITIKRYIDGPSLKILKMKMVLMLPVSLTEDRSRRKEELIDNKISLYISLYKNINRIDFNIKLNNKSKDHRIRAIFNSKIQSDIIFADGHFYIVPRSIKLPNCKGWVQKALPTNHQKDFICVGQNDKWFGVFNKGLPEYEAIKAPNGTIFLAITLLRCIEWLSRNDLATRGSNAGPDLFTPKAQCLGKFTFNLSLSITNGQKTYLDSNMHLVGKEFNNPLMLLIPKTINSIIRAKNKLILSSSAIPQLTKNMPIKEYDPFLPEELSFLEVTNKNIMLSALKKSENGDFLIIRIYNLSSIVQKTSLKLYHKLIVENVEIVNLLEELPENTIKANIDHFNNNIIELKIDPHAIATLKIKTKLKF